MLVVVLFVGGRVVTVGGVGVVVGGGGVGIGARLLSLLLSCCFVSDVCVGVATGAGVSASFGVVEVGG